MAAVTDVSENTKSESEVFEITDFTTASEWERFVSRVEEVLNEWNLTGNSTGMSPKKSNYSSGTWEENSQEINFVDFKFSITHYALVQEHENNTNTELEEAPFPFAMQELLCTNNDFPPRAHCLVRWYGIREFVVISPGANVEAIISESKCNLLLSSISISLVNSGCQVPIFVQIQQKWRRLYSGECQGQGVHTEFEMVHLRRVPSQYNHLSGLLDIFKSKTGYTIYPLPPINVAIRFTYILQDWQQHSWPLQPPDFDNLLGGEVGVEEFGKLPFGACEETISELHLSTTWPDLTEGTVLDNDVYSDLDPLHAPHWSLRIKTVEHPQCLLGDLLTDFFKLLGRKETTEEILGRGSAEEEGKDTSDISSALSKLTEPTASVPMSKLSVSNMVHNARRHIKRHRVIDDCPLGADVLNCILQYLFPDAAVDKTENKTPQTNSFGKHAKDQHTDDLFIQLKSAPVQSLTHRLGLCMCLVNLYHGGLRAVAYLWQEFVLELRYRWENSYQMCGLQEAPDLRCCLLHQKLQMLNCCIKRKQARDSIRKSSERSNETAFQNIHQVTEVTAANSSSQITALSPGKFLDSWSDSEEEFFECLSDQWDTESPCIRREKDGNNARAEGRMHPCHNMTLLNSSDLLFIPVTQEPAPMTEDLLEEQSEILAKLGTSAEGAQLRARMQSACLLSDMESFKAANPGSVLEDFVRWYSPRDFLEEIVNENGQTVLKGKLSPRMKIPGNIWVETWENAKAIPAHRQRRLFDDTKEAEKVLHYLEMQKPADLCRHLLPCIIHATILKLKEEEAFENIPTVKKNIQKATIQAGKLLQQFHLDDNNLEDCIDSLIAMEMIIAQFRSLKTKFGIAEAENEDQREKLRLFLNSLLEEPEVVVIGAGQGKVGGIIHRLFLITKETAILDKESEPRKEEERKLTEGDSKIRDFPSPAGREILLRTCIPRPAPYSKALPQRLFCVLTREEFRLVGAFSSDTSFF
ncbi:rab3 GTPase-activating protein catalytic subunit isoform X1 [Syngnathus scovelli]|uniref:rab3 GTPase-activating protein catalytic subunit isoform X1 n=2 Tax=Syngnathus scovelli TaxID=161590 RepID=UPI002110481E|nr:rab3 GTPase-activating protein catalytic subunit isoform X5 [Syngnathus scovelli]